MAENIKVNIGELKVAKGNFKLVAYGIGSCVVIVCYDKYAPVAGMLHAILPEKKKGAKDNKFVDIGIENLVKELINLDVSINNMEAKIFGGATMFDIKSDSESIGERNVKKAKEILLKKGIKIAGEDTGSNYGRTIEFDVFNKKAIVKSYAKGEKII